MRVRVSDPAAVRDLSEFLQSRIGAIVEQSEPNTLEVSLLGSYGDEALRDEVTSAVRRWSLVRQHPVTLIEID